MRRSGTSGAVASGVNGCKQLIATASGARHSRAAESRPPIGRGSECNPEKFLNSKRDLAHFSYVKHI